MQRTTKRATSNDSAQQPGASVATSLVLFSRIVPNKPTVPTVASRPRHIGWPLDDRATGQRAMLKVFLAIGKFWAANTEVSGK